MSAPMHDPAPVDPQEMVSVRVMHTALLGGVTLFLLVVLGLGFASGASGGAGGGASGGASGGAAGGGGGATGAAPAASSGLEIPVLLALISVALAVGAFAARAVLTRTLAARASGPDDLATYRTVVVLRAACLEAPALLGLVGLLLAGLDTGLAAAPPLVWTGLVPYVLMVAAMLVDRPGEAAMRRHLGAASSRTGV